ncbi:MotA/TolQ/ExbB proton channel family protein [Acidihalobacter prosperus]
MHFIDHLIFLSGGLPIIMALVLLIALAVIIERLWFYLRVFGAGRALEKELKTKSSREWVESASRPFRQTIQGRLVQTALQSNTQDIAVLDRLLDEQIMHQLPDLDRYLWILDTAVTLGPLLGLFGTIIGMIHTFNVLGAHGAAIKATGGIADALVATGMGLLIAIVAVSFLNFFNKRLRLALHELDLIRVMLINAMDEKTPRDALIGASWDHYESLSEEARHLGHDDLRGAEGA